MQSLMGCDASGKHTEKEVAVSEAEGSLDSVTRWHGFENLSMIVRMTDLLWEVGRPVTKSRTMCDHGREVTTRS